MSTFFKKNFNPFTMSEHITLYSKFFLCLFIYLRFILPHMLQHLLHLVFYT